MADGSIIIDTHIDNAQAQKDLAKLQKEITKTSSNLGKKRGKQSALAAEMDKAAAAADETRHKISQLKSEIASLESVNLSDNTSAENFAAQTRLPELRAQLDDQTAKLQKQTEAVDKVAEKYQEVTAEVDKITGELEEAGEKARDLAKKVGGGEGAAPALEKASVATSEFKKRIISLAKSALIFSVLTKALTVMRDWLGRAVASSKEASDAFAAFKGTLQGLAAPILNSVIPVLTKVVQVITQIISLISRGVSALFGATNKQALESAKGLNAQQKALEGVGGAASDAEKQLASFDEINKLSEPSAGGSGGGSDIGATFEEVALPDWMVVASERLAEAFGKLREAVNKIKENPAFQKIADFVKKAEQKKWGYVIEGLAGSIELLAAALSLLDAVLAGDWAGAWAAIKEILTTGGSLNAFTGAIGWGTDLGGALGEMLRGGLGNWWKKDVKPYFTEKKWSAEFKNIKRAFEGDWAKIRSWWNNTAIGSWWNEDVAPWFTAEKWETLMGDIKGGIEGGWSGIKETWKTAISNWWKESVAPWFSAGKWVEVVSGVKDGLVYGFKRAMNAVIDFMNEGIRLINRGMIWDFLNGNRIIIGKLDTIPNIPYLAQGAVIPPNREFMAVLGDQKSGTNIETPLSTMIEAFRTALNEGGYGGARTVVLEIDGREFGRATFDAYNSEAKRLGVSLGGA